MELHSVSNQATNQKRYKEAFGGLLQDEEKVI